MPRDDAGGSPETPDAGGGLPKDGGIVLGDSAIDVSMDARSEDEADAQDEADAHVDGNGSTTSDVVDAISETGELDASIDTRPEADAALDADAPRNDDAPLDGDAPSGSDALDSGTIVPVLIDDMEDNDSFILPHDGRHGVWFTANDGTPGASQTPGSPFTMSAIPGGRGASLYAARTSGHGFASWMPLMGFWFYHPAGAPKQAYDVSRYGGISFWARLVATDGANVSPSVRVVIPDRATDPDGMVCTGTGCNDHFGLNIALTEQWTRYAVLFSEMTQVGWGTPAAQFDAVNAYGVQFEFPVGSTFDCWVDDIAFVPR